MDESERCSVLFCTGHYAADDEKRLMFEFPKDAKLRAKWIAAIHRIGFQPTENSRVCERHFQPFQIHVSLSDNERKTGSLLPVTKKSFRLLKGAVPFLNLDPAQLTHEYNLYCGHFHSNVVVRGEPEKPGFWKIYSTQQQCGGKV